MRLLPPQKDSNAFSNASLYVDHNFPEERSAAAPISPPKNSLLGRRRTSFQIALHLLHGVYCGETKGAHTSGIYAHLLS